MRFWVPRCTLKCFSDKLTDALGDIGMVQWQVIDDLGVGSYQVLVVMFCSGLMLADGAMMLTLDKTLDSDNDFQLILVVYTVPDKTVGISHLTVNYAIK
jgi:hypothetical protein